MTQTIDPAAATAANPLDPTLGFRRRAGALALPLGFLGQLVANATYSWATRDGGGDQTGADALELYSRQPEAMLVATVAALIGCLLIVPGALAAGRVLRPRSPRLTLAAVLVIVTGYVCYFGIVGTNFVTLALAESGLEAGAALDASQSYPAALPIFLLFVIGNMGGAILLAIAVFRSREVPVWAGVGILAWFVLHVVGLVAGSEWFEVAGGVLQIAGLSMITARALRLSDAEWARRG